MIDFMDIRSGSKSEQVRAYAIEQSIDATRGLDPSGSTVIAVAKMFEDFINTGDVSSVITYAVEEGYQEGRFEVKEAVEGWFTNVDLDDLFRSKGWTKSEPEDTSS